MNAGDGSIREAHQGRGTALKMLEGSHFVDRIGWMPWGGGAHLLEGVPEVRLGERLERGAEEASHLTYLTGTRVRKWLVEGMAWDRRAASRRGRLCARAPLVATRGS